MQAHAAQRPSSLWAITAYFNPIGWRSRLANYRVFRQHLKIPLIAVELAYRSDFELHAGDADILIQLRGRDVMWQKERLLNIALRALPDSCDNVAWLDCDIIFARDDWPEAAARLLERFALVQLFDRVHWMPLGWRPGGDSTEPLNVRRSTASIAASEMSVRLDLAPRSSMEPTRSADGYAWAARRDIVERLGFYDACIVGGGPRAMAGAAFGCIEELMLHQHMNASQRSRFSAWGKRYHSAVCDGVGCLDGDIFHLWHGHFADRHYPERHAALSRFRFDPFVDIALDHQDCWRWNSDKPGLHKYVHDYFLSRHEDG